MLRKLNAKATMLLHSWWWQKAKSIKQTVVSDRMVTCSNYGSNMFRSKASSPVKAIE
jgi:hypothetical protein